MRTAFAFALAVIGAIPLWAAGAPLREGAAASPDVRNVRWGMTQKEVIKAERGKPSTQSAQLLSFKRDVAGMASELLYRFNAEGKLVALICDVTQVHSEPNLHLSDFQSLHNALSSRFGKPRREGDIWRNDLFRSDGKNWGTAVVAGHLAKMSEWRNDATRAELLLTGDNFKAQLVIQYLSLKLYQEEQPRL
jgi:hypothetical protein